MTRPGSDKRLERLLVLVPWVSSQEGPTVEEVCERFDMTERELAADLELLFMCGLYPFTPDTLMEADIVDGRVWIRMAEAFERPPAFSRQEAVSLIAAASAVVDLPHNEGNLALKSAITKLATALGINDSDVIDVELANPAVDALDRLRTATSEKRAVTVDYYSYGRDVWTWRTVEPYRVFNSEGRWYVQGLATEANEIRNFRVDRMRNVTVSNETFEMPPDLKEPRVYEPRADDPVVTLELSSGAEWVAEQYPLETSERTGNGSLRVELRVSEPLWLERLLLRLGPDVKVISGNVTVATLAGRVLSRYQTTAAGGGLS